MEHGLGAVELGDRRENTTGVAGQEDDVAGVVVGQAGDLGVGDVLDGVGTGKYVSRSCETWSSCVGVVRSSLHIPSGVLGQGAVIVVDDPSVRVKYDVLED